MPTWFPISGTVVQRVLASGIPASGYVLKLYTPTTLTNIPIATDSTGGTQANYAVANATGDWTVSGNTIIPHINTDYKLCIYPTQAAADADTGAVVTLDNIALATVFVTPATIGFSNTALEIDTAVDALQALSKGSLITSTGAAYSELNVGMDDLVLIADSGEANGIKWGSIATLAFAVTLETFNSSDTKTLPANTAFIMYTVVAGGAGGAGGNAVPRGGGGGAGGQVKTGLFIPAGNLTITVGAGGAGGIAGAGAGADGSNSVLTDGTTTVTAYGGGQALGNNNGAGIQDATIRDAGGGGGAGGHGKDALADPGMSGSIQNGNSAANSGSFGGLGIGNDGGAHGGDGGPGACCPLTAVFFGGGGGGGSAAPGRGTHGGANGSATTGAAASANTGGGGGGGYDNNAGGNGGSGKVILAYFTYVL
jgi:hypothetical protein